jgi:hypothetical protein
MLYALFWVIAWRLNFICRHFGTLVLFHLHRQVGMKNYPEESIQPSEHGESLKSGKSKYVFSLCLYGRKEYKTFSYLLKIRNYCSLEIYLMK